MMRLADITEMIQNASWFSNVGRFSNVKGKVAISSLGAWDKSEFADDIDPTLAKIAQNMDWLPTSKDQPDPFHGDELTTVLEANNISYKANVMDLYKLALNSMRDMNTIGLRSGPHDYAESAKSAALYCIRMSVMEVLANRESVWCDLLRLYIQGFWPCGILPDGTVVVY